MTRTHYTSWPEKDIGNHIYLRIRQILDVLFNGFRYLHLQHRPGAYLLSHRFQRLERAGTPFFGGKITSNAKHSEKICHVHGGHLISMNFPPIVWEGYYAYL